MCALLAYKRVSTIDQNTARQLADLNLKFEKTFEDKASGKDTNRPQLKALMDYMREGDVVYIHSLDRLARNLSDLQALVKHFTAKGVAVHFVKENLIFSTNEETNSFNKLLFQLLGSFAEFERNMIKERQREGIAKAVANGVYTGRKPTQDKVYKETKALIDAGMTTAEAIRQTGIKPATYYRYLKKIKVG